MPPARMLLLPAAIALLVTALPLGTTRASALPPERIERATPELARRREATRTILEQARLLAAARGDERSIAGRSFPRTILEPWTAADGTPAGEPAGDPEGGPTGKAAVEPAASPATDWSPYTGPFGRVQAAHLLRRATIGPRVSEVNAAIGAGLTPTLNGLLAVHPLPAPPAAWATEPMPDLETWTPQMIDSLVTAYLTRQDLLRLWWAQRMLAPGSSATEAMTLFWHDHFATGAQKVFIPAAIYDQNQLLRGQALGNFRSLVHAMAVDPAMLIWLDGNYNSAGDVNENFARELLELFTMGVGHYTQEDVRAAARAFTGYYTPDGVHVFYVDEWHDHDPKTFLGQTGDFSGDDIIEIVLAQPETARFIVRKLYRYFLDEQPDEALVSDLAATFRNGNYEIAPVMRRIFASARFFDPTFRGSVYADGVDRSIGLLRSFEVGNIDYSDLNSPQSQWTFTTMWIFGQIPLDPPNVGGWPGYRTWINSYTLPYRRIFDLAVIDGTLWDEPLYMQADVLAMASLVSNPNDAGSVVDDLAATFLGNPPTPAVRDRLLRELLGGMAYGEWGIGHPDAVAHLRDCFRLLVRVPDYQLK